MYQAAKGDSGVPAYLALIGREDMKVAVFRVPAENAAAARHEWAKWFHKDDSMPRIVELLTK